MAIKTGSIQPRGKASFRIRYYVDGLRQEETIKGTLAEAEAELANRLAAIANGIPVSSKPNTVTFEELAADVIADYKARQLGSVDDIEGRFRLHLNPVFGKRKAAQITKAQLNAYIVRRRGEEASDGTIARELEALKRAFNLALKEGRVSRKPNIPKIKEKNVRQGFFTRGDVERLTQHLRAPLDSFVWFAFLTGWRLGEIRGLLWRNIDFEREEIRLDAGSTKNGEGRVFPMTAELRTLLLRLRDDAGRTAEQAKSTAANKSVVPLANFMATHATFPVFRIGGKWRVGDFRKSWLTACHKAGLPCLYDKVTKKPIRALRLFHDLRRSGVRELAKTLGERRAMVRSGHKTRSVFDRYNIVSDFDLAEDRKLLNGANNGANSKSKNAGTQ